MGDNSNKEDAVKQLASEFKLDKFSRIRSDKSTKQIIKDIYDAVIYIKNDKEYEEKRNEWDVVRALNWLAIAAIVIFFFSVSKRGNSDFLEGMKLYAYILSVILSAIWIGVNIERTHLFRELWKFGITKLIISLFFTALVVFSTATASSIINDIFGIDASFFPFTRSLLTAYIFFRYASQLVYLLIFSALLNLFPIGAYFKYRSDEKNNFDFPWQSLVFIILTLVFSYFTWGWSGSNFDSDTLNYKVYLLAHQLDFNDNNLCENLRGEKTSVIFLGQNQAQILVDYNTVKPDSIFSFVDGYTIHGIENKNLKVMSCDY
ncbi:hypothetical protein J8V57_11055 [Xenorhabdus sp. PB61.4]|uniref:Na+/H+ antiporter NhaC family protein n=1 Tax=Xenorhabdus sp. PB61.4 TaxID=2788940 RepID=UPI001E297CBC|nr:Na+/H+ antiporter NhaC family protein [Xenorhabdus sp. PB61.4]MCC8366815.1 hypothetical protein [Xenorhabdus sp. PB61.4]